VRIAIIGSGIAGLTASHLLQEKGHEVHLYEAQNQLGMSAHTIDFESTQSGTSVWGDVPSRMFNRALWPGVFGLYQSLGLSFEPVDATQSYRRGDDASTLQFKMPFHWSNAVVKAAGSSLLSLAGSLGIEKASKLRTSYGPFDRGSSDDAISDRRSNFLWEINRLRKQGLRDLGTLDANTTFQQYLEGKNFSAEFCETFLFPALSSTVCTCSHEAISNYPAEILLDAMQHISGNAQLYRVTQGSQSIAASLSERVSVKLATPVRGVEKGPETASLIAGGNRLDYQHVVVATQANQVARVCSDLPANETQLLDAFQYEDVEVVLHTDQRFMPASKSEWAVFNFAADDQRHESMCTVWMNRFHTNWQNEGMTEPVFQTIRPIHDVTSGRLIRRAKLQRPVVNSHSWELWKQLREIHQQKNRRLWFCGSYAMPGIPLLESAVKSAVEISDAITDA